MATKPVRVFYPVSGDLFAAMLEERMAEHKRQMHAIEYRLVEEVIDEVHELPARAPRRSGYLFELLPIEDSVRSRVQ